MQINLSAKKGFSDLFRTHKIPCCLICNDIPPTCCSSFAFLKITILAAVVASSCWFTEDPIHSVLDSIKSRNLRATSNMQACSVSIDLTVTRGTLVQKFFQKCQYYYALLDQSVPLVTVRSTVSLLTEQLC